MPQKPRRIGCGAGYDSLCDLEGTRHPWLGPVPADAVVTHTVEVAPGVLIDLNADSIPLGVEFLGDAAEKAACMACLLLPIACVSGKHRVCPECGWEMLHGPLSAVCRACDPYTRTPPDYADIMTVAEFRAAEFSSDDGDGHPMKDGLEDPQGTTRPLPADATHVAWYNK